MEQLERSGSAAGGDVSAAAPPPGMHASVRCARLHAVRGEGGCSGPVAGHACATSPGWAAVEQ